MLYDEHSEFAGAEGFSIVEVGEMEEAVDTGREIVYQADPDLPPAYMPALAPDFSEERVVFTSADKEKVQENAEQWDATQFHGMRSSVLPLHAEDEAAGYEIDPLWRRSDASLERERRQVETLYRRLKAGRQPWMSKATFKAWQERERRTALRQRQRSAIVDLLRKLGRDPHSETVAAWVRELGYDDALIRLHTAAQRQGVVA